jgi:Fe-S oxidoreductase
MAPLVQGDADAARRAAAANVRTLAPLVREGYRVVCSDPTAALMLTQEYPRLLDTPDARLVAESTVELTAFLWAMHEAGELRTDFQPLPLRLGHHVPCHVKALGAAAAGPRLLSLIPALAVRTIDESCSGMAGTYGLRAENLAASLAAGQPMLDVVRSDAVVYGSTECGACRVQMQSAAGKRTLHPVQYLALAYGLLPELRARLARPLGRLLTDG